VELTIETTEAFYLKIASTGHESQLLVVTKIDGIRKDDIIDGNTDEMDWFNKSGKLIAKLRFKT